LRVRLRAENAKRAQNFAKWVTNIWGAEEDNIYIWDFRKLQTDGGLYLPVEKAKNEWDSHLNPDFGEVAAKDFTNKIISVIEN
jgi:hypothetical protein